MDKVTRRKKEYFFALKHVTSFSNKTLKRSYIKLNIINEIISLSIVKVRHVSNLTANYNGITAKD